MQKTNSPIQNPVLYSTQVKISPLVSVIVTTKNEEKNIKNCLRSIKDQTFKNIELIVVDNFSEDKTVEIAKKYTIKVYSKGPERSSQRNFGAKVASGEYLLYPDADMILDSDLVDKCLNLCLKGADAIVLPVLPDPSKLNNFWIKCRMLEQKMLLDDMVNVGPRFIDRSIFLSVGGYDETIVAWEDYDLHNRLLKSGCRVVSLQDSALWHLGEALSLREIVVRMVRYGKTGSLGLFTKKHGLSGLKQISIIRPSYFRHCNYFVTDPFHYIGVLVMKIVQTFSVVLGAFVRHLP